MIEKKTYELEDGTELLEIESVIIDDKNYLLLNEKNTENIIIAYEENDDFNYITPDDEKYREIIDLLYYKVSIQVRNLINVDK